MKPAAAKTGKPTGPPAVPEPDKTLLKAVSRSFYLSIRLLPARVRRVVSIAYLLARTSDTIADTTSAPPATRLRRLADFEKLVRNGITPQQVQFIQRDITPSHPGEAALIAALPEVVRYFHTLDAWDWKETADLLTSIIRGQTMDLETFNDDKQIIALPDSGTLEDYIYHVAGCVGEWWTRLCFHHLPNYSLIPEDELTTLGDAFGKGLQLVNILRDMPADLSEGRCYLPASELKGIGISAGILFDTPAEGQPVYEIWMHHARELLGQGLVYIMGLKSRRVRMACYIPWRLGVETLDRIEKEQPLVTGVKVKVPRKSVYSALWKSLHVAFSNKPLFS